MDTVLGGNYGPAYFDRAEVVAAESEGLSVPDAVLGHVLRTTLTEAQEKTAAEVFARVERSIVSFEIRSRCYNLCLALLRFLDALSIPSVVVWGSVFANHADGRKFRISALQDKLGPAHRPGHAWLMTPSARVVDMSLRFQDIEGDYTELQSMVPNTIVASESENTEPVLEWWSSATCPRPSARQVAGETKYFDLLGWTSVIAGDLVIRFLPGAPVVPAVNDGQADIKIGGLPPDVFYRRKLRDLE